MGSVTMLAISSVKQGKFVDCTKEQYEVEVRFALQDQAAKWIDEGQDPYAILALEEVKRLDKVHRFKLL